MFEEPKSTENLFYYTKRTLNKEGFVIAWVPKKPCTVCNDTMSKPIDPKTGKVKVRAKNYVCSKCGAQVSKAEYEDGLECYIKYKCPKCGFNGETKIPFKRKTIKGVQALVFNCGNCNENLFITKKLEEIK